VQTFQEKVRRRLSDPESPTTSSHETDVLAADQATMQYIFALHKISSICGKPLKIEHLRRHVPEMSHPI
jgi:hypothetical protein